MSSWWMSEQISSHLSLIVTNPLGTKLWYFSWLWNLYYPGIGTCAPSDVHGGYPKASTVRHPDRQVGTTEGWVGRLGRWGKRRWMAEMASSMGEEWRETMEGWTYVSGPEIETDVNLVYSGLFLVADNAVCCQSFPLAQLWTSSSICAWGEGRSYHWHLDMCLPLDISHSKPAESTQVDSSGIEQLIYMVLGVLVAFSHGWLLALVSLGRSDCTPSNNTLPYKFQ